MEDGYFLSCYLNPAGLPRLAGLVLRHDNNVSLWHKMGTDVRLLAHWELERVTGQKQHGTPSLGLGEMRVFVDGLLEPWELSLDDMTEVWGTPGLSAGPDRAAPAEACAFAYHSIAHLFSAVLIDSDIFYGGDVLGFAVDRGPDRVLDPAMDGKQWFAGCYSRRGEVEYFPVDSPGPLYGAARDAFGLPEGTLMALATATKASGSCDRDEILDRFEFRDVNTLEQAPVALRRICEQVRATCSVDPRFTDEESYLSAVMKEVQAISLRMMERNVDRAVERFSIDTTRTHLALAGGFALNCPTNSRLMLNYGFRGLLAPPCVTDGGQSIGIALLNFHASGERIRFTYPGAYLGNEDHDLDRALAEHHAFVREVSEVDLAVAVVDLENAPIAWFQGRSETGPRSLGNRSLLADPRSTDAKNRLNEIKLREWWRPVAPVVLSAHQDDWFADCRYSPYMLETFAIHPERRDAIPAVAHLDFSARIQSLDEETNPALYALITEFHRRTGVPILCNTSLNDKGEPIVETIAEAMNFCLRRRVEVGYFNGRRVVFHNFEDYPHDRPMDRPGRVGFQVGKAGLERARAELNPQELTDREVAFHLRDASRGWDVDIRTEKGAATVRAALSKRISKEPELGARLDELTQRGRRRFATFEPEEA